MNDIIFFLKLFCLTVVLVLFMQIQVGEQTIEWHTMQWVHTSSLVGPLNGVAQGGAKVMRDLTHKVSSFVEHNTTNKKKKLKGAAEVQTAPAVTEPAPASSGSSFRWTPWRQTEAPAQTQEMGGEAVD